MSGPFDVAIVGATGVVGESMLRILEERNFPCNRVHLLASARSQGRELLFRGQRLRVQNLDNFDFRGVALGLFSAGASISDVYAPKAVEAGCVVVDNTSRFRYEVEVPLVVPEVNPDTLDDRPRRGIVANPNCSTIQMVVALNPIYRAVGIERINVCTYQAVSGAGRQTIEALRQQSSACLKSERIPARMSSRSIGFNVIPHIDTFQDNGYTREEMKMVWETQKIFADQSIRVNPTAVRVPVFYGHSEAVHIETHQSLDVETARGLLQQAPGVCVMDDGTAEAYPTPAGDAAGQDAVFVGRIRKDISHLRGLNMWVVSDNVRKGAALNSVQIAETLAKNHWLGYS